MGPELVWNWLRFMAVVKGGPETGLVCWALRLNSALKTRSLVECCLGGYLRMMGEGWDRLFGDSALFLGV